MTENYTRYLDELLSHVFEGASEAERDDLIAAALDGTMREDFLADVMELNTELMQAMTRKMADIVQDINAVKTGIDK